jgi:hypothetical protein
MMQPGIDLDGAQYGLEQINAGCSVWRRRDFCALCSDLLVAQDIL